MTHTVKILKIEKITHDVLHLVTEKPRDIDFVAGQAADVSINKTGWEKEIRPFTFTSLPGDPHLEFTIKTYPSHNGVTGQLLTLAPGDSLLIHGVFGDIHYRGEGIFIAGGAGITPFIAILKDLEKNNAIGNNKLLFANKTKDDIILEDTFTRLLGGNFINVLSDEVRTEYAHGYITADLIRKYADANTKYYYLCGPDPMMDAVGNHLTALGIDETHIVKEGF